MFAKNERYRVACGRNLWHNVKYIVNYKGEYSNRLKDRCYGEVEVVPWND